MLFGIEWNPPTPANPDLRSGLALIRIPQSLVNPLTQKGEKMVKSFMMISTTTIFVLFGCVSNSEKVGAAAADKAYSRDRIYTVLPFDAIPAITNPKFVSASEAKLRDDAPVIGVSFNGESHAYSIYLLNGHEIVNDVVGGVKIDTTW